MSASVILQALTAGHAHKQAAHATKEEARLGTLSGGGSAGAVIDGKYYGKCGRLHVLRTRGISDPKTQDTLEMFEAGYANEAIVADLLARSGLKLINDYAAEFTLSDGRKVSSHMDSVVVAPDGTPTLVIECKGISSIWTARGVHYELKPKSDNLIQVGSYIMQTGTPAVLLYSSRVDFHLSTAPKWMQDKFADTYDVQYDADTGAPFKIRPFNRAYDVWFADGFLWYSTSGLDPVRTKVTEAGIRKYYDAVSAAEQQDTLLPRPVAKHVDGSKSYNACDYCPLQATCDAHEDAGFKVWFDHVQSALVAPEQATG
jgi:hypothetical protein